MDYPTPLIVQLALCESSRFRNIFPTACIRENMPTHPKFRFLTMEEFSKLSRTEKITYLERAIAQVLANKENAPEYILFIERRARPRKLPTGRK